MRRRRYLGIGVIIGLLVAIVLLIGPLAPLLIELGVEPVCIQGTFPGLTISRCPEEGIQALQSTPTARPVVQTNAAIPVIVDDDGSPDGMIALLYFLEHPGYDVIAVTISPGEAHPQLFAGHVARLLAGLGHPEIPVGYGQDAALEGDNVFPDPWRASTDEFWGITLPEADFPFDPLPSSAVLLETLNQASEPVVVFVTGTHTNIAEALALDPEVAANIRSVVIMGGAVNVPGNIASDWPEIDNTVAEWNIWVDPVAAQTVFDSGLPLHLVPLDATNQVVWTSEDAASWRSSERAAGGYAADILEWMLRSWFPEGVYAWDLVTAVIATDPMLCTGEDLAIEVITEAGPEQGWTRVVEGPANIDVCLQPVATGIKARVDSVFSP